MLENIRSKGGEHMDTNKEQGKETREPLAKFQARIDRDGRLIIPRYIRDALNIEQGDYVKIILRKINVNLEERTIYVLNQAQVISKVGRKGAVHIPNDLRGDLNIQPDELVEVILLDFYKRKVPDENTQFKYVFLNV
ncbi:hypothetical protein P8X24_09820 [Pyrococcus kukulkanii]|uniref:AbrB/MazE/SpoVT family DNA-binding domain-containing protein n=1 Tax=Pyrococcus kukulkanii TaxID=1609559 RepID=UPI003561CE62